MKLLTELDSLDNVKDGETRKLVTKATSSGSGNVVSSVSVSGDTITYTKGVTALTAHQNAFSNVKVGSTTVAADSAGDTLELVAGSNVTLTPDATNDKVTIAATDTTYESKAAASGGTAVSLVTTGEKYTWNNKQNALSTQTAYSAKGTATKVPQITTNTLGQVTKIEEVTITQPTVNNATLTIQKNGTTVKTFTANASTDVTANITVPTKVSELTNDSGYTTNTGTITKVQANGTDVASSGTANIPAATTSKYGVTELSSATNSTSEALAATPKAVKAAYDLAASKGTGTITGVSVNGTSVATSGVANITSIPASILSGAIPSAVTATTQSAGDNSTKIATTAFVKTAIDNLPDPMVFKGSLGTGGTITALPVDGSASIGDTYKVITAGTYASKAAKVGDTFICLTKTSSANTWELIPSGDEPSGTVTSITIKGSSPITVDSESAITTSGTRTISHANSGVTAGTYRSVTVNATGHVTAGTNPTTLSGYGITDAKIANGVITLGSNTIKPLTSYTEINSNLQNGSSSSSLRTISASSTIGEYAFATGLNAEASGTISSAEGQLTVASGAMSHAEGNGTTASAMASHAEGSSTDADGKHSHAENYRTAATGDASHAEGDGTVAMTYAQHTQGTWNIIETGTNPDTKGTNAVILGNGTDYSHRSNAHTIDWSGNAWFAGDVYVGSTSGTNKDAGSKKLLTASDVTDTKNTAGATDTSSKIYLIGATSQGSNPRTYSDNEVYATSGVLTTKSVQVGGTAATMQYNSTDKCIEFVFA